MEAYIPVIIGSIITLIAFIAERFIQSLIDKKGSLKIYRKIVYQKSQGRTWGFYEDTEGMSFTVPIWIEIQNTKNITEIVRNLNIALYKNKKFLTKMTQVTYLTNKKQEKIYYGDLGKYSFIVPPKSINKYELQFILKKNFFDYSFDEIKISYFDSSDKEKIFNLKKISNCWEPQENEIDEEWILMEETRDFL